MPLTNRDAERCWMCYHAERGNNRTRTGFEVGTRTAVDVLLALRETFRSQRDYTTARYDFLLNTLKLKKAAGILKPSDITALSNLLNQPNSASTQVTKYRR